MKNIAHGEEKVKRELEEIKEIAERIHSALDRSVQNRLRYELAEKLLNIRKEEKYREYGYRSFFKFATEITGLKERTLHYLLNAYEFSKGNREVFEKCGYKKLNALAEKYASIEEVPPEDFDLSVRDLKKSRLEEESPEVIERKLSALMKRFIEERGIEEFRSVLKRVILRLKEEGVL